MGDLIILAIFYTLVIAFWQYEWLVRGKTTGSPTKYILAGFAIVLLHATAMALMGVSLVTGWNILWAVIPLVVGDQLGTYFAKYYPPKPDSQ